MLKASSPSVLRGLDNNKEDEGKQGRLKEELGGSVVQQKHVPLLVPPEVRVSGVDSIGGIGKVGEELRSDTDSMLVVEHGVSTNSSQQPVQVAKDASLHRKAKAVAADVHTADLCMMPSVRSSDTPTSGDRTTPTKPTKDGSDAEGCCSSGAVLNGVKSDDREERRQEDIVPAGLLWSDFGGGREASDADAEGTASREFAEESLGLFHGVRLESDSVARSQVGIWDRGIWVVDNGRR